MTTIAYRDGCLAADSLITAGNMRAGFMRKIARNDAGWLGGCAGSFDANVRLLEWIEAGAGGDPPELKDADAIIVDPSGTVHFWTGSGRLTPVRGEYFAVGSGEKFAAAAMAMGADAIQAVNIAIELDTTSGGPLAFLFRDGAPRS